jgi:uncharacterized protein YjbJ (UPF0337 family)
MVKARLMNTTLATTNSENKEMSMNKDILEGNWKQLKGHVREMWGRITDDELEQIEGHRERLSGMLQVRYGYTRQEAENAINDFLDRFEEKVKEHL